MKKGEITEKQREEILKVLRSSPIALKPEVKFVIQPWARKMLNEISQFNDEAK